MIEALGVFSAEYGNHFHRRRLKRESLFPRGNKHHYSHKVRHWIALRRVALLADANRRHISLLTPSLFTETLHSLHACVNRPFRFLLNGQQRILRDISALTQVTETIVQSSDEQQSFPSPSEIRRVEDAQWSLLRTVSATVARKASVNLPFALVRVVILRRE